MAEYMGEYKIIRRMDGGGNANVFVAENARGEEVAIKILREESGNGKKAVKRNRKKRIRFKIETEMVVGIQDEIKGVIPIFSYGLPDEKTKKYWYAMPIAIPLEDKLKEVKSLEDKVNCVLELARTLEALHKKDIVHRDIKPKNIYFYNGKYCLGDFGLVDYPEKRDLTSLQEAVGPKATMAPEMRYNAKNADGKKADVVTIFMIIPGFLLTGYALFWRVIVDHEKVRYHSLFFGIGRSYPLKAITRVCRDEVYCLNIYKGKRKVITVDDEIEGIPYLMKWFANEGILVEDLKPGPEYYKVMEYPIHNWLMSAFEAFLALPLLGLWIYLLYKDGEIQGGMEILGVILATILLVGINIIMILGIIYNKVFYLKYQNGIYRYKKLFHEEEILKLDKTLSYKVDWDEGNIILYRDRKRLFTLHKGMANVRQFVVDTLLESDIPCIEGEKYLETFWRKKL